MCENVKAPMIEKRLNSEKGRKGDRERKDDEKKKERIEEKRGRESVRECKRIIKIITIRRGER
jgi:hypothetical protein